MSAHLLNAANPIVAILTVLAMASVSVLRSWISYQKTRVEEASRTDRLSKAIEGASPHQRSEIIRACGQLEGTSVGEPLSGDTAEGTSVTPRRGRPIVQIFRNKRDDAHSRG